MDDQQIFDTVATHLLAQGERSTRGTAGVCAYRGTGGLRCAVGCLIPNDRYKPSLEGQGVTSGPVLDALPWEALAQVGLLNELQAVHDWCAAEDWRARLRELAEGRRLRAEVLE